MRGGFFSFFRRRANGGEQKQLPAPDLFPCGICDESVERKDLFQHWFEHTVTVPQAENRAGTDSPMRSGPRQCSRVFIVRRPNTFPILYFSPDSRITYHNYPFKDMELAIAEYFAYAINDLKHKWPGTRFQYLPTNSGEFGWQTLMIIAEWDEE